MLMLAAWSKSWHVVISMLDVGCWMKLLLLLLILWPCLEEDGEVSPYRGNRAPLTRRVSFSTLSW